MPDVATKHRHPHHFMCADASVSAGSLGGTWSALVWSLGFCYCTALLWSNFMMGFVALWRSTIWWL